MSTESALLAATPDDMPAAASIIAALPDAPAVGLQMDEAGGFDLSEAPKPEVISLDDWCKQFTVFHYMGGNVIGAGQQLGELAAGEGGREAAEASYRLISKSEYLAGLFLTKGTGLMVDLAAVVFHAMACKPIIAEAIANRRAAALQRGANYE